MPTQEIEEASAEDDEIIMLRKRVQTNDWTVGKPAFEAGRNELTLLGKLTLRGTRLLIPKKLRKQVLELAMKVVKGSLRPSKDSLPRYAARYRPQCRTEVHNMSWLSCHW